MRTAASATLAVIALLLVGCSPTASEQSAPASSETTTRDEATEDTTGGIPDPCAILDAAVIKRITGYIVDDGVADPDRQTEYSSLCAWTQIDEIATVGLEGSVSLALAPGYPVPYKEEEGPLGATVKIEIPGAKNAFSVNDGLSVGMSVDGTYVAVSLAGPVSGSRADLTAALATEVAARLG